MTTGLTPLIVVNRALTEIAQGPLLASGDTPTNFDGTATGVYAATLYSGAAQMLLRANDPEFARRSVALVPSGGTPPLGWSQEYNYPDDCMRVRQVVPHLPIADPFDPQPVLWDVGDAVVTGIILTSISVANGSGYVIGDTGTVLGGTTAATYVILSVLGGGGVNTYSIVTGGVGYSTGTIYNTATGGGQPGVGTGFQIDPITVGFTAKRVIWTDQASATLLYTTNFVSEAEWDSNFTEEMVRLLGSMLAMPVAGRPDFSREMLNVAGKIGMGGQDRDS